MNKIQNLLLAFVVVATVHTSAARAATDYSDIWWNPAESGWGINLVQNASVIFATFFIYAEGGTPTWYVAVLYDDGTGRFSGDVAAAKGTFFNAPWEPGNASAGVVGTAFFIPSRTTTYQATLSYEVKNVGSATKAIERQTLVSIPLGGTFSGGQSGTYTGCTNTGNNYTYIDRYDLQISHGAAGDATFQFAFVSGLTCAMSGTLEQHGQQYIIPSATYACSDGLNTTAAMSEIRRTSLGIEGRFTAPSVGGGCKESASFSAVL